MLEETAPYRQAERPCSGKEQPNTCKDNLALALSQFEVVLYWHQVHQCFIRQWLAVGYIKNKQATIFRRWFLYSEYQDGHGNNHYVQHLFKSLDDALAFAVSDNPIKGIR